MSPLGGAPFGELPVQVSFDGPGRVPSTGPAVDLWLEDLDRPLPFREAGALLSREEGARARRISSDMDRRRFVASRGCLRRILGPYLSTPPEAVAFWTSRTGRPALVGGGFLDFNVSHSENLLLVGMKEGSVGVDVEMIRILPELEAVAAMAFTQGEMGWLREAPHEGRLEAFFRLWTGKEALLKALGVGFSVDPREVGLEPEPGGFRARTGEGPGTAWSIASLIIHDERRGRNARGAVAVPGPAFPSLALRSLRGGNGVGGAGPGSLPAGEEALRGRVP